MGRGGCRIGALFLNDRQPFLNGLQVALPVRCSIPAREDFA